LIKNLSLLKFELEKDRIKKMETVSKEDYLKSIYAISEGGRSNVTTSAVAKYLSVTNAAATDMIKKLNSQGYVSHVKYKGVKLTAKGKKVALKLLRRHRLWELFLQKALGLNWDEVHKEAERLEHQTSEKLINKIDEYLNHPKFDPHGAPIPDKNGKVPKEPQNISLAKATVGTTYSVVKVNDRDDELIRFLSEMGIKLYSKIKVLRRLAFDDTLILKSGKKKTFGVSKKIAENIFVAEK